MPEADDRRWLSVNEACKLLTISRSTFYRLIKRDHLKPYRLGERLRFRRTDVEALIHPVAIVSK